MPGTYWLTVLPDTSKLKPGIQKALDGVEVKPKFDVDETSARKAGRDGARIIDTELGKSGSKVKPQADRAASAKAGGDAGKAVSDAFDKSADGAKAGQKFTGGLTSTLSKLGPLMAGLGLAGGFGAVLSEGMNFTESLNVMGGVAKATSAQLAQVSETARQLGADASLPGVSATTAAQAMTELAKGGFSVEQSMQAARGTLQLAGAAGIDAAQAATIQADALHAFGLSAKDAGYAADVLANVANASTGEITDFAQGFQQAGAVASQFGLSIDDTAAALGTLANQGIKGSDAGTLIKSALLAITDQGKPAQAAIKELGLTLYDANGQFVGMGAMMEQLGAAAGRMSPEMYQAATNTLFGSDAARLAGVAAKEGATGFNTLKEAVNQQGGAAQMAEARMRGLPGAWANFQNTIDGVKLAVYDLVQGPLAGLLNVMSGLPDFLSRNALLFKGIGVAIAAFALPALAQWVAAQAAATASSIAAGVGKLAGAWVSMAGNLRIAAAAQWLFNAALTANPIGLVIAAVAAVGVALWAFFTKTETGRKIWAALWGGIKTVAAAVWDWMKGALSALGAAIAGIWQHIQPAVAALARFWVAVQKLNFAIAVAAIRLLGQAISWLWQTIAVPAFTAIASVASTMWAGVQVIWGAFQQAVQWVGDKIMWLWQTIAVPAFQAISGGVSTMWATVQPIWDLLVGAFDKVSQAVGKIKTAFEDAFNGVKDIVTSVWNNISGIFDTITNGINKVTSIVGGVGRADGGPVPAYATGGRITGPGSGRSDSILGFPAMVKVSNGEYIVNAAATAKYLPLLHALNAGAIPGFAQGGLTPHANDIKGLISRTFGIANIGGWRAPDGYNEHSSGNALDVMIPGWDTDKGKALGNQVAAWAAKNASALGLTGMIWRQTSYGYGGSFQTGNPMNDRGSPTQNHMDHVHLFMNDTPDGLPISGATSIPSTVGSSASASGSTRAATSAELSASGNRVDSANKAVTQAQQRVDDRTFNRDQAQKRLDARTAEGKDTTEAQEMLRRAERELTDATTNLTEKRDKAAAAEQADLELRTSGKPDTRAAKSESGPTGSDFGKTFMGGVMETIGLDGSLFSNPMEWPTVKSLMAGVNVVGKLLQGGTSDVAAATGVDLWDPQSGSPALAPGGLNPAAPADSSGSLVGAAAGLIPNAPVDNSININGNVGMDPAALHDRIRTEQNARTRTTVVR